MLRGALLNQWPGPLLCEREYGPRGRLCSVLVAWYSSGDDRG